MKKRWMLLFLSSISWCGLVAAEENQAAKSPPMTGPLIMIALDALHPDYLKLDAQGELKGERGEWLMPHLHAFLSHATFYPHAEDSLPAATDMNHLNALSGGHSGLSGEIGVSTMMVGWQQHKAGLFGRSKWEPVLKPSNLEMLKDDRGAQVDTLFHAFKREHPEFKTAFVSGKGWVAEMFRNSGAIDYIVTAESRPLGISAPKPQTLIDRCLPMSRAQQRFVSFFEKNYMKFPTDQWVVDASLQLFDKDAPQMAYILLAQQDDEGHALGAATDPTEFVRAKKLFIPPARCQNSPEYPFVSRRNSAAYRAPILSAAKEVDRQFGRLMQGLEERGVLANATVVLLSDHAMITHVKSGSSVISPATDVRKILAKKGLVKQDDFFPYTATSFGLLYWRNDKERVARAKEVLLAHRIKNPQTGMLECPWYVLDRRDMREGVEGIANPGELYHHYFVDIDRERSLVWPDLILLAKNGWQLPIFGGLAANLGASSAETPFKLDFLSLAPFIGGHGSIDTRPIVMAFSKSGGLAKVVDHKANIADIAVTLAHLYGLSLRSTTVGRDLSSELE